MTVQNPGCHKISEKMVIFHNLKRSGRNASSQLLIPHTQWQNIELPHHATALKMTTTTSASILRTLRTHPTPLQLASVRDTNESDISDTFKIQ